MYTHETTSVKIMNAFITPNNFLLPLCNSSLLPFPICLPQPVIHLTDFCHYGFILQFLKFYRNWNHILYTLFCLTYFSQHNYFEIYPCCIIYQEFALFFFSFYVILYCVHITTVCSSIYLLVDLLVFSFGLSKIKLQGTYMYSLHIHFFFLLGKSPVVEWLDQMVGICLTF